MSKHRDASRERRSSKNAEGDNHRHHSSRKIKERGGRKRSSPSSSASSSSSLASARRGSKKERRVVNAESEEVVKKTEEADDTGGFDRRLNAYRARSKLASKRERQLAKERETPEQKRQRRLVKKMLKEEKRRNANKVELPESIPYTDANNPFNDNNLTETFVWNKKLEADGLTKMSRKEIEKMNRERIRRNVAEMEELKRNRDTRQAMKEDMEMMSREAERSQASDWRRTEDVFHLKQAKLRSKIRLQENRAKPIDYLARYINYGNENDEQFNEIGEFELKEPLVYLKSCTQDDYDDLLSDIKVYRVIDGHKNDAFWKDITTIVEGELKRIAHRRREELANIPAFVESDILNVFKSKSYGQLEDLGAQIRDKIAHAGRGTDVAYWERTLELLHPHVAKLRLKELHAEKLALRLRRIREEQRAETTRHERETGADGMVAAAVQHAHATAATTTTTKTAERISHELMECDTSSAYRKKKEDNRGREDKASPALPFTISELEQWDEEMREKKWQMLDSDQLEQLSRELYAYGCYSPTYGDESQAMPGIEILDEDDDSRRIEALRAERKNPSKNYSDAGVAASAEHARMLAIAQSGMSADETAFSDEAALEQQSFLWSDKYRPRKPRYFNRVHTGFDWNKYNQTHYDMDNPPPKIVQGYRFNIFYPDLLDSNDTPKFKLIECEDPDFAILRFQCGPPYEDIAFKIVNREWEINHKHGYKCQFQNGVFQLWFFFKRYRYRR